MTDERGDLQPGIAPDEFIRHYPQVYHMAEYGTWGKIRELGLLSTSALLDLFGITGTKRTEIESRHRPHCVTIEHPVHGRVTIRDQIPMRESSLNSCLEGMTPQQWYELLNRHVFLWASRDRLLTLLQARAYRSRAHCVLTIDTATLIDRHVDRMALSPINSGSTIFKPQPRGPTTFLPLDQYPFAAVRRRRAARKVVVEVAIRGGVPDIEDMVTQVQHMRGAEILEEIFSRRQLPGG